MKCFIIYTPKGNDEKDFVNLGISIANMSVEHIPVKEDEEFRYFLEEYDRDLLDFLQGSMGIRQTRNIEMVPVREKKMKQLLSNPSLFLMKIGGKAFIDVDSGMIGFLVETEEQEARIEELL